MGLCSNGQGTSDSLSIGALLGARYRIERSIGRGAMGIVYAARDVELCRDVALKVLPSHRLDDPDAVERFMRQARAMARIEHRGTVRVYDRGMHDDRVPYVVMERLNGRDLRRALRESGPLSVARAVEVAIELCEAIVAVHRQGVVHRDLKPANVFLVEGCGDAQVKLLDFGIAQMSASVVDDEERSFTASGAVLGTLPYLAPEVLDGAERASPASDLYGLACTLYEMIAGHAPFRADNRAELLAAILRDPPRPLRERVPSVPEGLDTLIRRSLAKDPRARHGSVHELLEELRAHAPLLTGEPPASRSLAVHAGALLAGRFRLVAQLGEGSFGTVFEAVDVASQERLALKRLRLRRPTDLFRFKREFRIAADVVHPSLVRLHELWIEDDDAFFTMELIDGVNLLRYLRETPASVGRVFMQLFVALSELHRRGLVHRDLKPDNALVDRAGRLVLLDFGLMIAEGDASQIGGSLPYMPKEARAGVIASANDLYAAGVMLHEALTGERPSHGSVDTRAAGDRIAQRAEVEPALWSLCSELLAADPSARPSADAVVARLSSYAEQPSAQGSDAARDSQPPTWESRTSVNPFVGRERERALLRAALARTALGQPSMVLLRGQSGYGKSALLAELARSVAPEALCLVSGARESERVPYPALDSALDALTEHLCSLPGRLVEPLLPRHSHAIAQLFPVLNRLEAIAERNAQIPLPRDPALVRTLAFGALRRLLRRLCEQRPLVWIVDDAQWIDAGSATLLGHVLSGPEPPPLLFVAAQRTAMQPNPALESLLVALRGRFETLELAALDPRESTSLVHQLTGGSSGRAAVALGSILREARGNPLFLATLVAHVEEHGSFEGEVSLEAALQARIRSASEQPRALLELACVCARPLPLELLLEAAGASASAVRSLCEARSARRVKVHGREAIEPYHARVREAVLGSLSKSSQLARHRRLADTLMPHADAFPEALIEHLAGAGDGRKAAELAARAALAAQAQLAFDRAAALYAIALNHGEPTPEARIELLERQACALRNAGRSVEAAFELERASRIATELTLHVRARHLLRDAGELMLLAGRVETGLELLEPVLKHAGLALDSSAGEAIATGLTAFARLMQRGLSPLERSELPDPAELERVDLCLCIANGLALIDLRGLPFAVLGLELALELSDTARLQKTSAAFVTLTAGLFFNPLIEPALALCQKLTGQLGTPYACALLHQAEGEAAHFGGRFLVAEAAFERVERILLESCVGANRELAAVRNGTALIEYAQKGDFRSQLARTLTWQTDAEARQDTFHENVLRVAHSIVWIAQDNPDRARAELARAQEHWCEGAGAYELGMLEFWDIIDRYEGDDSAHLHPLQGRTDLIESPAANSPFLGGYIHLQRAWGAIRALSRAQHDPTERARAEQAIEALRTLGPEVWQGVANAYEANLAYLGGQRELALALLERAERSFRRLHARCLAACVRMRHGELAGGSFGARLTREATEELTALGVARPDRWSRAYFSLYEPDQLGALTHVTEAQPRPVHGAPV